MKHNCFIKLIIFSLLVFLNNGCKQTTVQSEKNAILAIDIETDYQNDSVKVELDNVIILEGRINTNYIISAAWISGAKQYPEGNHLIKVTIFGFEPEDQFNFNLKDTMTVTINFDRQQKQIKFEIYNGLVLRD